MPGFFILLFTAGGLSLLFPRVIPKHLGNEWIGTRLFLAFMTIPIILYIGNLILGLPLHWLAWALAIAATFGWGKLIFKLSCSDYISKYLWHPLPWLLTLFPLAVFCNGGAISYLTVLSDEYTNWLGWARQMVVSDQTETPEMMGVPPYLPGWTYLLALPGLIIGKFEVNDVGGILFVLHVAFLGMLCDLLIRHIDARLYVGKRFKIFFVWAFILIFLTMETSWKLVPTNVMSERPQFYVASACFLLGWVMLGTASLRLRISLIIGVLLTASYMVKTAAIVLVPSIIMIVLVSAYEDYKNVKQQTVSRLFLILAALLVPFFLVFSSWHFISSPTCGANPSIDSIVSFKGLDNNAIDLAIRYGSALLLYTANYKLPLTIIALCGFTFAVLRRPYRWILLGLLIYILLYVLALYWVYLTCYQGIPLETLSSHQRYFRVVLRTIHIIGVFFIALGAIDVWKIIQKRYEIKVQNTFLPFTIGIVSVCTLLGWQLNNAIASVDEMQNRFESLDKNWVKAVQKINEQAPRLLFAMKSEKKTINDGLLVIAQNDVGDIRHAVIAAIAGKRRGDELMPVKIRPEYSFSISVKTPWTTPMNKKQLRNLFMSQKALWPIILDPYTRAVLQALVNPEVCNQKLENYFLIRIKNKNHPFRCVVKN